VTDDLDVLLSRWAGSRRLTEAQIAELRERVLASAAEADVELDADWMWSMLRPMTSLLERSFRHWPFVDEDDRSYVLPYLQLA
jgi:hypothetical protein